MVIKHKEKILLTLVCALTLMIIGWYQFQTVHEKIASLLKTQSHTVSTVLDSDFNYIEAQMEYLTNQISKDPHNSEFIYMLLSAYDTKHKVNNIVSWNMFTWIDSEWNIIVDGQKGIFDKPRQIYRPYLDMTKAHPNSMHVGIPRYGAVSNRWLIPAGMGVTDKNDTYLGAVIFGFDISDLKHKMQTFVDNSKIEFYLIDKHTNDVIIPNIRKAQKDNYTITDYIPHFHDTRNDSSTFNILTKVPFYKTPLKSSNYTLVLRYNPDLLYAENISILLNTSLYVILMIVMYFALHIYKNRYFENFLEHITNSVRTALEENKFLKINESSNSCILINSMIKKYLAEHNELQNLTSIHAEEVRKNQSVRLQNVNQLKTNKIIVNIREKEYRLFATAIENIDTQIEKLNRGSDLEEGLGKIKNNIDLMRFINSDKDYDKNINITKLVDELGSIVFPELMPNRKKFIVYGVTHTNKKFYSNELLISKMLIGVFNSVRECYSDSRIVVRTELEDHFLHINISFNNEDKSINDLLINENHVQPLSEIIHSDINHAKLILKTLHGKMKIRESKGKCDINLVLINESATINYNKSRSLLQYSPQETQ